MTEPLVSFVNPRLDEKPWGGQALRRFDLEFDDTARIGEALVTANDAIITAGFGAGRTLGEIVAENPQERLGEPGLEIVGGRPLFPLLVKLIDANENLSIQVHPNDTEAAPFDRLGKTEAWYVLAARPGSKLYLGLRHPDDLPGFIAAADRLDGSSAAHLRAIEPHPGDTYLLPAGTIHALGAGVMVYEIQQPSDITYRLDDWGRVDNEGRPREMHREQGLAVVKATLQPAAIAPVPIPGINAKRKILVETAYFALEWWHATHDALIPSSPSPQVLTMLSGALDIANRTLEGGQSCVVWPGAGVTASVDGEEAEFLRAWIPESSAAE